MNNEKDIIIPQRYSRRAFFSIPFLLLTFYCAYLRKFYRVTTILPFLLITSILHWNKLQNKSIHKADIFMVVLTILSIDSYSIHFRLIDKLLWRFSLCVSSIAYIINKYVIKDPIQKVYIHMIFIHMFSGVFSSIAIYNSSIKMIIKNKK